MTVPGSENKQETHFQHFIAASGYSIAGAKRLWREKAFRQELVAVILPVIVYPALGADLFFYVSSLILALIAIAVEALNTAIEEIIDRISPEISTTGKHAKDLGSFAVMCLLIANGALLAYALILYL